MNKNSNHLNWLTISDEQKQEMNKEIKCAELLGQINWEDVDITEDSENLFSTTFLMTFPMK